MRVNAEWLVYPNPTETQVVVKFLQFREHVVFVNGPAPPAHYD